VVRIVAIGNCVAASAINVGALIIDASATSVIATLSEATPATIADDPAAARTPGFKSRAATEVAMDGHFASTTVMHIMNFAYMATLIAGDAMAMFFTHISHCFVPVCSVGSAVIG
jgi:hypothetical protein